MNRRKLLWRVYPYYFMIIVISLVLATLYASREIRRMYIDETTSTLLERARLVDSQIRNLLVESNNTMLDMKCKELGRLSNTRITVVGTDGAVVGDSDEDPLLMENHGSRPEITRAFDGEIGVETRFSNTLQTTMIYVAVPVEVEGKIAGVVRTSYPVTAAGQALGALYGKIAISGIVIAALATIVSLVVFRRLTRPLRELKEGAEQFAEGHLEAKLPISSTEEIAALAESMNRMAAQLDTRIRMILQQRNEREAILSSMSEGVLALDASEKVVSLNRAAARFLGIDPDWAPGKPIHEAARIAGLHDLVDRTLNSSERVEMEITLPDAIGRCLQAHGTALNDDTGKRVGVVLVFNDITRLKRLETIRRDFVANVSHELKTPITAIIGSVETLLDGGMDNSEDNRRFLDIIAKHSDRLNSLVEDLLSLARLESEYESGEIKLSRCRLKDILESSVRACLENGTVHEVAAVSHCDPDLEAYVNPAHMEQAVTNLIDNAIRYSEPGTAVTITAEVNGNEIVIAVQDEGPGIEAKHLPRLFERFYRVDKARSRKAGGTGLGLAIVKHIALAHGGRVSVDSQPGIGSTFRIHLPKPMEQSSHVAQ